MREKEKGLSLAEVLVALTVMTIAGTIALFLYDVSRKSFQKGENATEQQQAVRIAFDELSSDVRLAGFDANPDGELDPPDDAVEAAYDTAIVLRANYDAEDPVESPDPEAALAGAAHRSVSVGNDEIVAYVLVSPDGPNPDTLVFQADVGQEPRDGVPETIRIDGVSLTQDHPPYTLYRVTLNKNTAAWGGADALVRKPLVENIRSLTFRYHAANGAQLNSAFDLSGSGDDIGGMDDATGRRVRASIRRIEVQIEGLTRDPDLTWQDSTDTNVATRQYRKFQLRGDVTPRNLGRKGLQDIGWDLTPPTKPATPTLVAGHCEGLWVQWAPNPPADKVVAYRVHFASDDGLSVGNRTVAANAFYLGGLTHAKNYRVKVMARDAANNFSPFSDEASQITTNDNDPSPPANVRLALTQPPGRNVVAWDAVTTNTNSTPSADPAHPMIRDLEGYRVLRSQSEIVGGLGGVMIADERLLSVSTPPSFADLDVVACRRYYYIVQARDYCDRRNDTGQNAIATPTAAAPPAAPTGVTAVRTGSQVRVSWLPTGRDTAGGNAYIDTYEVYRQLVGDTETPGDCGTGGMAFAGTNDNPLQMTMVDILAPAVSPGQRLAYRVRAKNDCATNQMSACSDPAFVVPGACSFSGNVVISLPRAGYVVPPVPVAVTVDGGDVYTGASLTFVREEDNSVRSVPLPTPGTSWAYTWPETVRGTYLIKAKVDNSGGCSGYAAIRVRVGL